MKYIWNFQDENMKKSGASLLQGARSPSGRPQQFWQVETFEESEVLRDSAPEHVVQGQLPGPGQQLQVPSGGGSL